MIENNVILIGAAKENYVRLQESNNDKKLFLAIQRKAILLKIDSEIGIQVHKNMIPKEYLIKYNANNLWKINLPLGWRMIYLIQTKIGETTCAIIDVLKHKDYEKKFGY